MDFKLTEAEFLLIEKLRILAQQDPTFEHLPHVITDRLDIMVERGKMLNGGASSLIDQIYYMNDQSAFHRAFEPLNRLKKIIGSGGMHFPDDKIKDKIQDSPNFCDMWLCCREEVKHQGLK